MTQEAPSPQEVDLYSPIDPDSLPDDPAMLKQLLLQLLSLLRRETKRREDVERNMDLLLRKLNAPKSVPSGAGQQMLFDITTEIGDMRPPEPASAPPAAPATQRKHLETITQRYEITFSRSTTCDWMLELAEVLRPLWEWMIQEVLRSRVIHTDDTTVQLQDPDTGQMSKARFWNYIGDEEHALTVLDFTRTHERQGPATFLANYRGYLQADAYNGYDGLYLDSGGRITEVGCWQHARKRYKEAAGSDVRAHCGMAFIKSMYAVEEKIRQACQSAWKEMTLDERATQIVEVRQRETAPLMKSFRHWIEHTIGDVLPKSELADAFRYTLNQWKALNQFVSCGLLDIDNNPAERAHRGIAIGRKNWMHIGSERGGRAAAVHFSLIASCKMNGVEPYSYLVDVLNRLPATAPEDMGQLSPNRWKPASTA